MQPQPTHRLKNVKPIAIKRLWKLNADGFQLNRYLSPPPEFGSVSDQMMMARTITSRSGIRIFPMRSIPLLIPKATATAVSTIKEV